MTQQINVYLAADSTVQTYSEKDQGGWGEFLELYFSSDVKVLNHAIGGRSSKTFIEEGRLEAIVNEIKAGDFLFVQMGHNDSTKSKPERYTEPFTTYKSYLQEYVDGARRKEATPVLITPVARLHVEDGVYINDFPDYCQAMKEVAIEEEVILIDLMSRSLDHLETIGYDEAFTYFMAAVNETDYTHFTKKGANEIAKVVAHAIKESPLTLSSYIK